MNFVRYTFKIEYRGEDPEDAAVSFRAHEPGPPPLGGKIHEGYFPPAAARAIAEGLVGALLSSGLLPKEAIA